MRPMSRINVILGLWLLGFVLGFAAFIAFSFLGEAIVRLLPFLLNIDAYLMKALLSGFVGSFVTVILVIIWSYSSKKY